jgi:iron complex transport system ATP-binding protein
VTLLTLKAASYAVRGRNLVDAVELALDPGELLVVVGPNGAGKSTLVKLACGELTPTGGRVLWEGQELGRWPAWSLAAARAVLPQASGLAFPFTVGEVVRLGLDVVGRALPARRREEMVRDALARGDVGHLVGRSYQTLSGGERQRVHFARAVAQLAAGRLAAGAPRRQALFLDEPTASLDIHHQLLLMHEARRLAREGVAVLAVLHDLNLAAAVADRVVLMRGGRLVATGAPEEALSTARIREVFAVEAEILRGAGGEAIYAFSMADSSGDGRPVQARR